MARRRRRDLDDDEDLSDTSKDDEDDSKSVRSRRRRRERYDRRQDFALLGVLIIIILAIVGSYFAYTMLFQGDEDEEEQFNTYQPPTNPGNPGNNNNNNNGGSSIYDFPEPTPSDPTNTIVVMEIQDYGSLVMELYDNRVPITTTNFIKYVEDGFYNGLLIHRVAQNPKVIQGGGFRPGMDYVDPTYSPIMLEIDNSLTHVDGALAMARTNDPNSATSQFYISVGENHYLDDEQMQATGGRGYAVFGQVIYGHEVYRTVNNVPVNNEAPIDEVLIKRAYIYEPL